MVPLLVILYYHSNDLLFIPIYVDNPPASNRLVDVNGSDSPIGYLKPYPGIQGCCNSQDLYIKVYLKAFRCKKVYLTMVCTYLNQSPSSSSSQGSSSSPKTWHWYLQHLNGRPTPSPFHPLVLDPVERRHRSIPARGILRISTVSPKRCLSIDTSMRRCWNVFR